MQRNFLSLHLYLYRQKYFLPFALISLCILTPLEARKTFCVGLIMFAFIIGFKNITSLCEKNIKIQTVNGVIYTNKNDGQSVKELTDYVMKNTDKDDRVVVYPECLAVNFLSNRKSDNKFYSLIPLYVETFGEDMIIKRLEMIKPEYVIISNYDTSNYYFSMFGGDYAERILYYIIRAYDKQEEVGRGLVFSVYRIKNYHPVSRKHV